MARLERTCVRCGKPFFPSRATHMLCSIECRKANAREKDYLPQRLEALDRELTDLSVYLIHKYHREGMPVHQVMSVLGRSKASVLRALAIPLTREQETLLREFFLSKWGRGRR